jgi:hypothetical protein
VGMAQEFLVDPKKNPFFSWTFWLQSRLWRTAAIMFSMSLVFFAGSRKSHQKQRGLHAQLYVPPSSSSGKVLELFGGLLNRGHEDP